MTPLLYGQKLQDDTKTFENIEIKLYNSIQNHTTNTRFTNIFAESNPRLRSRRIFQFQKGRKLFKSNSRFKNLFERMKIRSQKGFLL